MPHHKCDQIHLENYNEYRHFAFYIIHYYLRFLYCSQMHYYLEEQRNYKFLYQKI